MRQASRAVAVRGGHLAHRFDGGGLPTAGVDEGDHVLQRHLVQQLLPVGVVIALAGEVGQLQAVVRPQGRHDVLVVVVLAGIVLGHGHLLDGLFRVLVDLKVGGGRGDGVIVGEAVFAGQVVPACVGVVEVVHGGDAVGGAAVLAVVHVGAQVEGALVQHRVGAGTDGHAVGACLQDVAAVRRLDLAGIVGGQVLQGHGQGNLLGSARLQQASFGEVQKVDAGLFNAAVGVGRGEVQLHHVLARHAAGVGDGDLHGDGGGILLEVGDLLRELGIAQAVAEGVLDVVLVVDEALLGGGLVELIAHVDTLHVVHKGEHALEGVVVADDLLGQVLHPGKEVVARVAGVVPGGGLGEVLQVGVRRPAGGVDGAGDDLAQGGHAGRAGAGGQDHRADGVILVHPVQLHGVVGVDDHDDLIEAGAHQLHQVLLGAGQLQVVLPGLEVVIAAVVGVQAVGVAVVGLGPLLHGVGLGHVIGAVDHRVHVGGQVGVLAAGAPDDDDGGVGEGRGPAHDGGGVRVAGGLRQGPVLGLHGDGGPLAAIAGVHLHQLVVHGVARVGQGLEYAHRGAGPVGHVGGAGAAVYGIGGGPAEHVQVGGAGVQRQQAVILHQHHTLIAGLLDDGQGVAHYVVGDLGLGGVEHAGHGGVQRAVADQVDAQQDHQHPGQPRGPAHHVPGALLYHEVGGHHDDDHHQQRGQDGVDVPADGTDVVAHVRGAGPHLHKYGGEQVDNEFDHRAGFPPCSDINVGKRRRGAEAGPAPRRLWRINA